MPDRTHLLVAGGGPAALEAALAVQRLAGERVQITLLSDRDDFVYRPVAVAEPFGFGTPERFSLERIAADRGFAFARGSLAEVEPAEHRVRCQTAPRSPTTCCCSRSAHAPTRPCPERSPSAARRTACGCAPSSSGCAPAPRAGRVRRRAGDRVDAAALRARADDGPLGGRARARRRAVGRHLRAPAL